MKLLRLKTREARPGEIKNNETSTTAILSIGLEEFNDNDIPPYAVLSHTWESRPEHEVLFSDFPMETRVLERKPGYAKLVNFCSIAKSKGYNYAWMDTCCINKTSTTELAEAINSMYKLYQQAGICIAYLSDFDSAASNGHRHLRERLQTCRWFTRGWTLQELIAPRWMEFFGRDWHYIGTKRELKEHISNITRIPWRVLLGDPPDTCSIAQRMSWAAGRTTKRPEDRAYSLLGIFDVNLPMLYGMSDAQNAFVTLQKAIMEHSDDQTIFAWTRALPTKGRGHCGLLATTPDAFADSGHVVRSPSPVIFNPEGYGFKNVGLTLQMCTKPYAGRTYLALLDCVDERLPRDQFAIFVERLADTSQFARVRVGDASIQAIRRGDSDRDWKVQNICVQQRPGPAVNERYGFWLRTLDIPGLSPTEVRRSLVWSNRPTEHESNKGWVFDIASGTTSTAGIVYLPKRQRNTSLGQVRWIKIGFDGDFSPVILLGTRTTLWGPTPFNLAPSPNKLPRQSIGAGHSRPDLGFFNDQWMKHGSKYGKFKYANKPHHHDVAHVYDGSGLPVDSVSIIRDAESKEISQRTFKMRAGLDLDIKIGMTRCLAPPGSSEDESTSTWWIRTIDITAASHAYLASPTPSLPSSDDSMIYIRRNRPSEDVERRGKKEQRTLLAMAGAALAVPFLHRALSSESGQNLIRHFTGESTEKQRKIESGTAAPRR
ncbi:uncharacterized protein HMPREF1541_03634 [Cyphellophora europaea CBS 101466]|uniref:Heterokaryon incompatibility domain-containing protein n=1 Tax=Cyphellophora europaea (strain CBS 101466) TaxID=1220924 RepID=W2S0X2_CYPE1|nr:uncharacterized protein HMPREF1541_03634 [Cyphellophora europaea CBS 101466]ETN41698.1 hypothetical protein HMPREF1541_03634 [Cyphellophora europaea CBS 101466]